MINDKFKNKTKIRKFFFVFGLGIAMLFVATTLVYLLWNAIIPKVTSASEITFWQAMGILILSKILFGGMRFGPGSRGKSLSPLKSKWQHLSEEEKLALKEKWKARCQSKSED